MAVVQLDDRTGLLDLIVFPRQYGETSELLQIGNGIFVEGEISIREGEKPKVILNRAVKLLTNKEYLESVGAQHKLYLRVAGMKTRETDVVLRIISCVKGNTPVMFYDRSTGKSFRANGYDAAVTDQLLRDLGKILGDENVVFK